MDLSKLNIGIIGLGYVGLQVAISFSQKYPVIAYDNNIDRISELRENFDRTREVSKSSLKKANCEFTCDPTKLDICTVYIITVPTPIDKFKIPDLSNLLAASKQIGMLLKRGDTVIYESTVFPSATEDYCVPVLERTSGLLLNEDFFVGYSPERINPGDNVHKFETICKITSGSTSDSADFIDTLYKSVVKAGTHKAPSIKVAEAAKVIENIQRDVNIALINELATLFDKLNISTQDVLKAAKTKWNFIPFKPGLVGGHCIGVDPFYLTHKAKQVGHNPEIILGGRRINDFMPIYAASKLIKKMLTKDENVKEKKVLVLGFTFKENTPDVRNSKIEDFVKELESYHVKVDVFDPVMLPSDQKLFPKVLFKKSPSEKKYHSIVLAVPHSYFIEMGLAKLKSYGSQKAIFFDMKSVFDSTEADLQL